MSAWTRCLTLIGAIRHRRWPWRARPRRQTKLKWAHVYEITEPYHTEALWAAERDQEAHQRQVSTSRCFRLPSSATRTSSMKGSGSAPSISSMSASTSPLRPTSRSASPARRSCCAIFDHWKAYRDSKLFARSGQGLRRQDPAQDRRAHLLRPAPCHRQQAHQQARGHEGHEAARAAGAAVSDVHEIRRRQRHADRLLRCLSRAAAGHWSTARRIRCRRSWPRSSTRCRATSC